MPYVPFLIPITWLVGLLSLALLGGGVYLLWAWYVGALVGTAYLVGGLVATIWTFVGHRVVLLLMRRAGRDEPKATRDGEVRRVARPDGSELQVEVYGPPSGPTILMTHGLGTHSTAWYYAKKQLAERFRLIVWDLPGLGKSRGPSNADYSLEKMAHDLEAVLQLAGDGPVILLGHSIGGMITITFCRLFRRYLVRPVVGLVLVNTTYANPATTTSFSGFCRAAQKPLLEPLLHVTAWLSPLARLVNVLSYLNGSAHIQSALTGFAGTDTRGMLDLAAWYTPARSPAVLARATLDTFRFDGTATLATVPVPALVVTGHLDRVLVPEASVRIAALLPAARLVTLTPANHLGFLERNEEFAAVVAEFATDRFAVDQDLVGSRGTR